MSELKLEVKANVLFAFQNSLSLQVSLMVCILMVETTPLILTKVYILINKLNIVFSFKKNLIFTKTFTETDELCPTRDILQSE